MLLLGWLTEAVCATPGRKAEEGTHREAATAGAENAGAAGPPAVGEDKCNGIADGLALPTANASAGYGCEPRSGGLAAAAPPACKPRSCVASARCDWKGGSSWHTPNPNSRMQPAPGGSTERYREGLCHPSRDTHPCRPGRVSPQPLVPLLESLEYAGRPIGAWRRRRRQPLLLR